MPVNLSIKNVPDAWADALRARANRNHRSLQGELMAILEQILRDERELTPMGLRAAVQALGLQTPAEAAEWLRSDRDSRAAEPPPSRESSEAAGT